MPIHHNPLPMERIRTLLKLEGGVLLWAVARRGVRAGEPAGTRTARGYGRVIIDGKAYLRHRIVLALETGRDPGSSQVDHRNVTPGDDWPDNLREAVNRENLRNRGRNRNNTSGYKGVSFDRRRGRWRAVIMVDGRQRWLGYYADPLSASAAYEAAAKALHGEFARS